MMKLESSNDHGSIEMPLDLMMEVFSWLPGKSLMRFKSVSKYCSSLITHPIFVEMHHTRSYIRNGGAVLLLNPWFPCRCLDPCECKSQNFMMIDWTKKDPMNRASVHESSLTFTYWISNMVNGLISYYTNRSGYDDCISVYNFTTREILPLPPPPPPPQVTNSPYRVISFCQLGFDPVNKVYKVLNFWCPLSDLYCEVLTLDGNENRWRSIKVLPHMDYTMRFSRTLYNDGFLYWNLSHKRTIFTFDIEHEQFDFISYPQDVMPYNMGNDEHNYFRFPHDRASDEHLTLLRGNVSLVTIPRLYDSEIILWRVIDRKGNHMAVWTKEVIKLPFHDLGWLRVDCSDFGLVSYGRESPIPNQFIIECYILTTGKYKKLKVNNAQGLFNLEHIKFLSKPVKLVENIISLRNIGGRNLTAI